MYPLTRLETDLLAIRKEFQNHGITIREDYPIELRRWQVDFPHSLSIKLLAVAENYDISPDRLLASIFCTFLTVSLEELDAYRDTFDEYARKPGGRA